MQDQRGKKEKNYRYEKTCFLDGCGTTFKTNRKWQIFCYPGHQAEYWKIHRRSGYDLLRRIQGLEREQAKLRKKFEEVKVE